MHMCVAPCCWVILLKISPSKIARTFVCGPIGLTKKFSDQAHRGQQWTYFSSAIWLVGGELVAVFLESWRIARSGPNQCGVDRTLQ